MRSLAIPFPPINITLFCPGVSGKLDLIFAIDGSSKVYQSTFQKMLNFAKGALNSYTIGPNKTHVGVLGFGGNKNTVVLQLKDGTSKSIAENSLRLLKRVGGPRRMNKAIRFVSSEMFSLKGGGRRDAAKALVLFTTGKNDAVEKLDLPKAEKALKDSGVKAFVIGVGKDVDADEMNLIATDPENTENLDKVDDLPSVLGPVERFAGKVTGDRNYAIN